MRMSVKIPVYRQVQGNLSSLSPGQTIATVQRNISQHCWPSICKPWPNDRNISTQHIATLLGCVGRNMLHAFGHHVVTCCGMLRVANRTSAHALAQHCCTNLAKRLQHPATSTNVAWKIWPFSNLSQQHPTCRNTSQQVATWWPNARNMLRPTMLRYVALKCCDRLAGALPLWLLIRNSLVNYKEHPNLIWTFLKRTSLKGKFQPQKAHKGNNGRLN